MDESLTISQFKDVVSATLNRVMYKNERFLLERHHKPNAAIVSIEDYEFLKKMSFMRGKKLNRIYEHELKQLEELLEYVGTESLNEFLLACSLPNVKDAIKKVIKSNNKLNK